MALLNNFGNTPLDAAALNGNAKAAEVLIKNGADVNAINAEGNTPLHAAAKHSQSPAEWQAHTKAKSAEETAKVLIKAGAKVDVKNNDGNTAADLAHQDVKTYFQKKK